MSAPFSAREAYVTEFLLCARERASTRIFPEHFLLAYNTSGRWPSLPFLFLFLLGFSSLRVFIRHGTAELSTGTVVSPSQPQVSVAAFIPHRLNSSGRRSSSWRSPRLCYPKAPTVGHLSPYSFIPGPCVNTHRPLLPSDWLVRGQNGFSITFFKANKFIAWLPRITLSLSCVVQSPARRRLGPHPVQTGIDTAKGNQEQTTHPTQGRNSSDTSLGWPW